MQPLFGTSVSPLKFACITGLTIYVLLFGFDTLTRTQEFRDPDTMNFIDVANNVVAGRGIRQSTLGFNQPKFSVDDDIPTPLTHQPPLYPLAIAAVSRAGLSTTEAGVLISVLCYGFVLVAGYQIAGHFFGEREALAATTLLALFAPLREFSQSAFSEPMGLALAFGAFWLLALHADAPAGNARLAVFAGLVAGVACATRYALAPLIAAGAWFLFLESPHRYRDTAGYLLAAAIPIAAIVTRNLSILHGALLPHYLPSTASYADNIRGAIQTLTSQYTDMLPASAQVLLLVCALALLCGFAAFRHRLAAAAAVCVKGKGAQLLTVFAVAYSGFLIVQRTHSHIDPIGPRYMLPASVTLLMLLAVFFVRASNIRAQALQLTVAAVALLLIGYEARVALRTPAYDPARAIAASERLTWVRDRTSAADLIIGEDTVDIPFYLHRPAAISYSPYPYTEALTYEKTLALCRRYRGTYSRILLLVRAHDGGPTWLRREGAFVADAAAGELSQYPALAPLALLRDGRALQVTC